MSAEIVTVPISVVTRLAAEIEEGNEYGVEFDDAMLTSGNIFWVILFSLFLALIVFGWFSMRKHLRRSRSFFVEQAKEQGTTSTGQPPAAAAGDPSVTPTVDPTQVPSLSKTPEQRGDA